MKKEHIGEDLSSCKCPSCKGVCFGCAECHSDREIQSEVNIRKEGKGYFIEVKDQYTENRLAVSKKELEKIVLYSQKILDEKNPSLGNSTRVSR